MTNWTHRFEPSPGATTTLLLLHGTGGNESDLLPLGRALLPGANLLSPRGPVLENGMPRFFRRLAEGVFDEDDIRQRAQELADFVGESAAQYGFDAQNVWAVGYSNGANIAASALLQHPHILRGAVLLRAMVPLVPPQTPDLKTVRVLLLSGRHDRMVPVENAAQLAAMLREAGADVTQRWHEGGHELARKEIDTARKWLAKLGGT